MAGRATAAAVAATAMLVLGAAAGEEAVPGWIERYSSRPGGPCHWLNLAPITARVDRPGRRTHRFDATRCATATECRAQRPAPVLLVDCCTRGETRGASAAMVIEPFPDDPPAESVLSALFDLGAL